jgi:hypothetical protein
MDLSTGRDGAETGALAATGRPRFTARGSGRAPSDQMLAEADKRNREVGVTLWLAGLAPEVYTMVERSPLGEAQGRDRLFFNLELAVDRYRAQGMDRAR